MTVQGPGQPVGPLQQTAADQPAAQSIPAAQAAIAAAQVAPLPTPAALDQPYWAALRCDYIARAKGDPLSVDDISEELKSRHAPAELICEVSLIAVKQDARALRYAHESIRANREIVLEAVSRCWWVLEYAHDSLKSDPDIVLAAVRKDGAALRYAHESIRANREIVFEAVSRCGWVLEYAHDSLKSNPEIVLAALRENWTALRHASEELKANPEIVLEAVRKDGCALEYAAPKLKADPGFMLEAVKQNAGALKYVSTELRADPGFMLEAVKQNAKILPRAYLELRANPAFLRLLCALFEPRSTLTFDAKKRLFMTACGHDMVELKTAMITEAIAHLVLAQRTFEEENLQSLIKELDLLENFSLMADFLFNSETLSFLQRLPRQFGNKDLKIAWALSNLYLSQLDHSLIPDFERAIDSDKKGFKNHSNLKVFLRFLNQFIDDSIKDHPRSERVLAIVGHLPKLFEQQAESKKLFDRMAILTIYDQCALSESINLDDATPALQDALLDRFIPEDLSPAAGAAAAAAAAAASSSSSSAPDLRANLKKAIIKSPHPAALLHYLTTLESNGQLEPGEPGFELLQRIAMGDFKERRHTTCSHPAMTEAMRAQWEASAPDVQVAGQSLTAVDSEDWKDLLFCGTGISGSCLNCKGSFQQNAGLLGICLDGKIRMATVKNANGVIIARCIMRLTVDQAGNTCLFKENIYPKRYERPSEADAYAQKVARALDTLVQHKAEAMRVALYTYASDAAAASPRVTLSTPPNIAGFDYSDVNSGTAIASFQFPRVHRLYQPG